MITESIIEDVQKVQTDENLVSKKSVQWNQIKTCSNSKCLGAKAQDKNKGKPNTNEEKPLIPIPKNVSDIYIDLLLQLLNIYYSSLLVQRIW